MSLYNMLCGECESSYTLMELLEIESPLRYRDCWIREKNSRLIVTLYARQGGGNRVSYRSDLIDSDESEKEYSDDEIDSEYQKNNSSYYDHPYFLSDKDWRCDGTYNKIKFDVTDHPKAEEFRALLQV